jgi:hypothetical protein
MNRRDVVMLIEPLLPVRFDPCYLVAASAEGIEG